MCEFFSCIATRDGRILFTENNSHEIVIRRANLRDDYSSNFVRLEVLPPFTECSVDQHETPSWFDEDAEVIKDKAVQLANHAAPAWEECEKVRDAAREEYRKVEGPAREEYYKMRDAAREEYRKAEVSAWKEYYKVKDSAQEEYVNHLQKIEGFVGK